MASTRLPGKPLADIGGEPMIVWVWRAAIAAKLGRVLVACAEPEIAEAVKAAGGEAVVTAPDHTSGSDRVFEAVSQADPGAAHDVVVNLQGDLPTIEPALIQAAVAPLSADPAVDIGTLVNEITADADLADPNKVKTAVGFAPGARIGRALYFSRHVVPGGAGPHYHHIGIYAFRREALARFVSLPKGVLEARERLEQLRALEAGMRIDVALVDSFPMGVDTPADLDRARTILDPGS